jgi:hypothetical protein
VKLYSYVVAHDFGFAPNPFHGACTLATCKPEIRKGAVLGDYIVGTGSARHKKTGFLVYFMRVEKILTFDEYWSAPEFECKRPSFSGNKLQAFGDNIYHRHAVSGVWLQANSFHSQSDGQPHQQNVKHDTQTSERVLIGEDFVYWGSAAPEIPPRFRNYLGDDICKHGQGHHVNLVPGLAQDFISWMRGLGRHGYIGRPLDWGRRRVIRGGQRASGALIKAGP